MRTDKENPDKISTVVDFIWEGDDEDETADTKREAYLSELAKTKRNE